MGIFDEIDNEVLNGQSSAMPSNTANAASTGLFDDIDRQVLNGQPEKNQTNNGGDFKIAPLRKKVTPSSGAAASKTGLFDDIDNEVSAQAKQPTLTEKLQTGLQTGFNELKNRGSNLLKGGVDLSGLADNIGNGLNRFNETVGNQAAGIVSDVTNTAQNAGQEAQNAIKNIAQNTLYGINRANDYKNMYLHDPAVKYGGQIARTVLPDNLADKFLGSEDDKTFLQNYSNANVPTYEQINKAFKNNIMSKEDAAKYAQLRYKLDSLTAEQDLRDVRNKGIGTSALALGITAIPPLKGAATIRALPAAAGAGKAVLKPASEVIKNAALKAAKAGAVNGAVGGAVYGAGNSIIDENINPVLSIPESAAAMSAMSAALAPVIGITAAAAPYMGKAAVRGAKNLYKEAGNRLNPQNYETVQQTAKRAQNKGVGLSEREVYETKYKKKYISPEERAKRDKWLDEQNERYQDYNEKYNAENNEKYNAKNPYNLETTQGSNDLSVIAPNIVKKAAEKATSAKIIYNGEELYNDNQNNDIETKNNEKISQETKENEEISQNNEENNTKTYITDKDGNRTEVRYNPALKGRENEIVQTAEITNPKLKNVSNKTSDTKRQIAQAALGNNGSVQITNRYDSSVSKLTKNTLGKMISTAIYETDKAAKEQNLTPQEKQNLYNDNKEIIANAPELFEQSVPILEHGDINGVKRNIGRYALPVKVNGRNYNVMFTVKNDAIDSIGILYDLKAKNGVDGNLNPKEPNANTNISIANLTDFVNGNLAKYGLDTESKGNADTDVKTDAGNGSVSSNTDANAKNETQQTNLEQIAPNIVKKAQAKKNGTSGKGNEPLSKKKVRLRVKNSKDLNSIENYNQAGNFVTDGNIAYDKNYFDFDREVHDISGDYVNSAEGYKKILADAAENSKGYDKLLNNPRVIERKEDGKTKKIVLLSSGDKTIGIDKTYYDNIKDFNLYIGDDPFRPVAIRDNKGNTAGIVMPIKSPDGSVYGWEEAAKTARPLETKKRANKTVSDNETGKETKNEIKSKTKNKKEETENKNKEIAPNVVKKAEAKQKKNARQKEILKELRGLKVEVTKLDYVPRRYQNRYWRQNVSDEYTNDMNRADKELNAIIDEIRKDPNALTQEKIEEYENILTRYAYFADRYSVDGRNYGEEAAEKYFDTFYKAVNLAQEYNETGGNISKGNIHFQKASEKKNNIVDLTNDFDKAPTIDEVKAYINELVENGTKFATLSPDWFVDVKGGSKKKDHIIKSSDFPKMNKSQKKRHNKYVMSLEKLLNNAEYAGSKINVKKSEKPNVERYHYFKTYTRIGDKVYQILFDTEQYVNEKSASSANILQSVKYLDADNISITNSDIDFKGSDNSASARTVHLYDIREIKNPEIYFQTGWHGTPHDFDEFSNEYMGTGEGAQAHGWGTYIAKSRSVSEGYRKGLVKYNERFTVNGEKDEVLNEILKSYGVKPDKAEAVQYLKKRIKEAKSAVKYYEKEINSSLKRKEKASLAKKFWGEESFIKDAKKRIAENTDIIKELEENINYLKNLDWDKVEYHNGQLFEVDIPEDDVLLDEQKPFSQQSKKVKEAIINALKDDETYTDELNNAKELLKFIKNNHFTSFKELTENLNKEQKRFLETVDDTLFDYEDEATVDDVSDRLNTYIKNLKEAEEYKNSRAKSIVEKDLDGKEIYGMIAKDKRSQKAASELLNKYGIKGITYDGYQDGRCYVIFNDKDVKIVKKYYQGEDKGVSNGGASIFDKGENVKNENNYQTKPVNNKEDLTNKYYKQNKNAGLTDEVAKESAELVSNLIEITARKLNMTISDADKTFGMNIQSMTVDEAKAQWKKDSKLNGYAQDNISNNDINKGIENARGFTYERSDLSGDTENLVVLLKGKADISTIAHETGHVYLNALSKAAKEGNKEAKKITDTINKWLKSNGNYTYEQHEKFAESFVEYIRTNKAPNSALREVFRKFKEWLNALYQNIKSKFKLSKEAKEVFDEILGENKKTSFEKKYPNLTAKANAKRQAKGEKAIKRADTEGSQVPNNGSYSSTANNKEDFKGNEDIQSADTAGAGNNEIEQAKKEWQEKGVESRFFKKWFGDSKVVDEKGKPKLLTDDKDVYILDGYSNNGISKYTYKMSHRAPSSEDINADIDDRFNYSLEEVAQGKHNQPDDYFSSNGARWYGYNDTSGMESHTAIDNIIRGIKAGRKNLTVTVYRAIPNDVNAKELKNGDWVTFSKSYAKAHGEHALEGDYKIIEQKVPVNEVWWDGNDIREWGYDNGKENTPDLYLSIQNPAYLDELPKDWKEARKLRDEGYDGVITSDNKYLVFEKPQIKSVNNQGTFDKENPNIYLQSAAMKRSEFDNIADFCNNIINNPKINSDKRQFNAHTKDGLNIRVPRDTILHEQKKHKLTPDEWQNLLDNIDNVSQAVISRQTSRYDGKPVLLKVKAGNSTYGVVLETFPKNNPLISTAFIDSEKNIDNWLKNEAIPSGTKTSFLDTRLNDIITDIQPNYKPFNVNNLNAENNVGQTLKQVQGDRLGNNPLDYDYIHNQKTGEKIQIEMNEDIKADKIEPQTISNELPFEVSEKPSENKNLLVKSLGLNKNNRIIKNKNTNENAVFSKKTIEKSLSNIKIGNASYNDFCNILFNSEKLFETSQKILSHNDVKNVTDTKISRYANIAKIGDNGYLLEFVAKDNGDFRLYSVDMLNKEAVPAKRIQDNNLSAPGTADISIADIQKIFKSKLIKKYNNDYKNGINAGSNPQIRFQKDDDAIGLSSFRKNTNKAGEKKADDIREEKRAEKKEQREQRKDINRAIKPDRYDNIAQKTAKNAIRKWKAGIEKSRYDVDKALNSLINHTKRYAKDLSKSTGIKINDKQIREIMPFLRERTDIPEKLNRPDLKKIYNKLSNQERANLRAFADEVSNKFQKYYENYNKVQGVVPEQTVENHISHIWDLDKKHKSLLTNYFATQSGFAKQRTIETLMKGINGIEMNGETVYFTPKTLDYAEILKISSDSLIKATYDRMLAEEVKNLSYNGEKFVKRIDKAPSDWVKIEHPALSKALYKGKTAEGEIIRENLPVAVHPDIADTLLTVFETQKPDNAFWKTYDAGNAALKQVQLGFSGFHGFALSEAALGNMGLVRTLKVLNPIRIIKEISSGNYGVYKEDSIAKHGIEHGLQLGTPTDLDRNMVEKLVTSAESSLSKIPYIGNIAGFSGKGWDKTAGKILGGGIKLNNKVLWNYLHNNFKLETYKFLIEKRIRNNKGKPLTDDDFNEIAQWVNDSFGGLAWELLGVKPSAQKQAKRAMLSPDWFTSTLRQFMGMFATETGSRAMSRAAKTSAFWKKAKEWSEAIGIDSITGDPHAAGIRGKIARAFWVRSLVYMTILYNLLNAAMREEDRKKHPEYYPEKMTAKDYSLWGNYKPSDKPVDKALPRVFIGRNKEGKELYMRWGKQFREVPELGTSPRTHLGNKAAPLPQLGSKLAFGHSLGGFEDKNFFEKKGNLKVMKQGADLAKARLGAIGNSMLPISVQNTKDRSKASLWALFQPVSKGMSFYTARESFEKIYKQGGKQEDMERTEYLAKRAGMDKKDIENAKKQAKKDFTKPYKDAYVKALQTGNQSKVDKVTNLMERRKIPPEELRRIYGAAFEEYRKQRVQGLR